MSQPRPHRQPAQAPPLGPNARSPAGAVRGCAVLILLCFPSRQPLTRACVAVRPPGLRNSVSGRGPRPLDEEQSRQAVGRLPGRRRSWVSTMAATVRAAGILPVLCGAPAGESKDAGSRGSERGGSGGSPRACRHPGGKKREAAAPASHARFLSRWDLLCDLAPVRILSGSQGPGL